MSSKSDIISKNVRKPKFPELPPKYSSSRELRNKAEKMRRDRLNTLMEEMRSLVPIICNKKNKSDKTRANVLRLTANYLKVSQLFPTNTTDYLLTSNQVQNNALVGEGMPHLESLDGFFIMMSEKGKIMFVSENVEKHIGYNQIELVGTSIADILHPGDNTKFHSYICSSVSGGNSGDLSSCSPSPSPGSSLMSPSPSPSTSSDSSLNGRGPRRSFYSRLREKPLSRGDMAQYQHMHIVGHHRRDKNLFVGVIRPVRDRPITELNLIEAIQDQYLTRHLPDGRIVYSDHRISTVAGYIPSEVCGKSAFNFFYAEDLPWTTMAMRNMFASSNGEGSTVYRLFAKTGELICLQTKGFLEYNTSKNKIESFLCINTVIRPEDQEKYLQEQKEKFTPFITELHDMDIDKPSKHEENTNLLTSTSAKVSVISKISSIEGTRSSASLPTQKSHVSVNNGSHLQKASIVPLTGKRKRNEEDYSVPSKYPKNMQYISARQAPFYRLQDGVRVIDMDNNAVHLNGMDQSEDRKTQSNLTELINQINVSLSTPAATITSPMNTTSVIQKASKPQESPKWPSSTEGSHVNATYNGHSKERTGSNKTTYDTMEQMIAESQIKFSLDELPTQDLLDITDISGLVFTKDESITENGTMS